MEWNYLAKLVLTSGVVLVVINFMAFSFSNNQFPHPQPQPDFQPRRLQKEQRRVIKTRGQSANSERDGDYGTSNLSTYQNVTAKLKSAAVNEGQIEQAKYHLRFWDLVNGTKYSDHVPSTLSLFKEDKLDYLWRPVGGQQDVKEETNNLIPQIVWQMEAPNSSYAKSFTTKTIVLWDGFKWWNKKGWDDPRQMASSDCEIFPNSLTQCIFTQKTDNLSSVDAVIAVRDSFHEGNVTVPGNVLKFYFMLESPFHAFAKLDRSQDLLATYWRGSDIVTPYARWAYYDLNTKLIKHGKNYAQGKSKTAAAFISNCFAHNGRMDYIKELQKYIEVDVYGSCGKLNCARSKPKNCFEMLKKDYYFYMSFEGNNCRDYVTEKLFDNGLSNDIVPIVMGAHPEDYQALAPYKSYIHVEEFNSPKKLAEYLDFLIKHPSKYNEYFEWKGTGEFISFSLFCQLCAMVHYADIVPPPERTEPYVWGRREAIDREMCLPKGQWYWTKYNNGTSRTKEKH